MNSRPDNHHISSMPALRTTTIITRPKPLQKGDAVIVTDIYDKPYEATYEGKEPDSADRAIIKINGSRTSVFNYKIRRAE